MRQREIAYASCRQPCASRRVSKLGGPRGSGVQVAHAARVAAFSGSLEWGDGDGQVVAVHQAHILEVLLIAQGQLHQGH